MKKWYLVLTFMILCGFSAWACSNSGSSDKLKTSKKKLGTNSKLEEHKSSNAEKKTKPVKKDVLGNIGNVPGDDAEAQSTEIAPAVVKKIETPATTPVEWEKKAEVNCGVDAKALGYWKTDRAAAASKESSK